VGRRGAAPRRDGWRPRLTCSLPCLTLPFMPPAHLPRYRADAWPGGFTVASPFYTASISAVDGMVVGATELIYRLRPGAMAFETREPPEGMGDVVAVAVEPRRPRREQRIAVATMHELHIMGGGGVASVPLQEEDGEIVQLLWGPMLWTPDDWKPAVPAGEPVDVLYVRCENTLLQLLPDGSPFGVFARSEGEVAGAWALATDHAGGFAYVCVDQDTCEVEVWTLAEAEPQLWHTRVFEAPGTLCDLQLAVAGRSLAVSLSFDGVWMTRDCKEHEFTEVEDMRGRLDPNERPEAAAIAFEGSANDAALFAAVRDSKTLQHIVRVDAAGRVQRIAEVELETNDADQLALTPIRALAWDATRSTLWSAAGRAGIMRSTAPGAPSWLPAKAAS
jgi:hypothetical protein